MILLDTHIWVWLVQGDERIDAFRDVLAAHRDDGYAVSDFSCWEVAMLVARRRLTLGLDIDECILQASSYPDLELLPVTRQILVDSVALPEPFHADPADRIIVATARSSDIQLLTADRLIRGYGHVRLA